MKLCARVAKINFGGEDLTQIKVWVDQLERPNGDRIAFPCQESYSKNDITDDTITAIWAKFVEEFGYVGAGSYEAPFMISDFTAAVKRVIVKGTVGMSCDKDLDNPSHWTEI